MAYYVDSKLLDNVSWKTPDPKYKCNFERTSTPSVSVNFLAEYLQEQSFSLINLVTQTEEQFKTKIGDLSKEHGYHN
jgi:hypothetical protein